VRAKNPLSVVHFKNTFGVPLEGGPISIFEDNVYVGEAMLPSTKAKAEQWLAYSVELKVDVTTEADQELRDPYKSEVGSSWDSSWNRGYVVCCVVCVDMLCVCLCCVCVCGGREGEG